MSDRRPDDLADPALAHRLRSVADHPVPDGGATLDRLRPRFAAARARRRNRALGAVAAVVVLAGFGSWAAGDRPTNVRVGGPSPSSGRRPVSSTSTSTSSTEPPATTVPDDAAATPSTSVPIETVPGGDPAATAPSGGSAATTTSIAPTTPGTLDTVPWERSVTYTARGGTVVVSRASAAGPIGLVSQQPADGFTAEVRHDEADRVEVRFRSATHESRVEVRLVGDQLVPSIEELAA